MFELLRISYSTQIVKQAEPKAHLFGVGLFAKCDEDQIDIRELLKKGWCEA